MQLRYVGKPGEFLMGVPARDLSDGDFAELPEFAQAYIKAHLKLPDAIYEQVAGARAANRAPAAARKGKRRKAEPSSTSTPEPANPEAEKVS